MKASNRAISLIKSSESLAKLGKDGLVRAYPDPAKGWALPTIGWGCTGPDILKDTVWTVSQCENRLAKEVEERSEVINKLIGDAKTTQGQFDAFLDFMFNLGVGNLKTSTLLKLHKAGKTKEAAEQFVRWNKASGKVMKGLTVRRLKEKDLYLSADTKPTPA